MDQSETDSFSQPVKSLRSKFEQLAQTSPNSTKRPTSTHGDLLTPEPTSPRPRATSNTYSNHGHHIPEVHRLRTSSSSSDLRVGKRPPPPPPSRGSKPPSPSPGVSPSASPLLRPVPIPTSTISMPDASLHGPRAGSSSSPARAHLPPSGDADAEGPSVIPSVASLRSKFVNASPISVTKPAKPLIPPRQAKSIQPSQPSLTHQIASSPDEISYSTSTSSAPSSLHSPFLEDGETDSETSVSTAPPALPARKIRTQYEQSSRTTATHSRGSSRTSSESDASQITAPPPKISRPTIIPPRPPPRNPPSSQPSVDSSVKSALSPPPLPLRRSTIVPVDEPQALPRLPVRPQPGSPVCSSPAESVAPPHVERKTVGSQKLPPPPTRTIALGDKLPPARRPASPSSDEDSGEEDDPKSQVVDNLPDSSRSSRRPPVISFSKGYSEPKIHVQAHSGHVAVSGTNVVVATHRHIRIFDLAISDIPVYNLDTKDMGSKELKVTSMEFRPAAKAADRGQLVWVGTKDGHVFELDIRTGSVTSAKFSAHLHTVTHIFRHGRSMVTLDDGGKVLVFVPDAEREDVRLTNTQPRVVRMAEKQEFAKMIGGKLWTATRSDLHGGGAVIKTPIIRVYDIFTPGSVGRSVLPTEHVGPVTSATILPSQPGHVYVGHEEGFITLWSLETDGGFPQCIEVMKVSMYDVLSLEGVNDRLWAGGRNGMISAYDVTSRPWVVTNCWMAHPGLPVLRLAVDHYGIEKTGRMCVVSVGRDEQLKLWDGLLGSDWIDQELLKRETSFSRFRDLNALIISWNVDAARPDSLNGDPSNINFLHDVLSSVDSPDIISFGFQEVIDLESRKMTAKNVLLGNKKDGGLSEHVTGAYKRWYDRLVSAVRLAMPPDTPYSVIHTESLVGLFSCIFIKNTERISLKDMAVTTIKRGIGGRYGNKGGIVARFVIEDSSICLINCHLAAGQNSVRQRNADVAAMLEDKSVFPVADQPLAYVGGGDGSMVLDHEIVFVNGDMNYRIDQRREPLIAAIRAGEYDTPLAHDQLLKEIKFNRGCRFRGFSEGPLSFPPTYKYDRHSSEYDSSEKRRSPAWCDRVLWRSRVPSRVHLLHYQRYEPNVSDHRPISAGFTMTIKSIRQEVRQRVESEVQMTWFDEQQRLLSAAREFYVKQLLI